jgi:hypothetical protein
MTTPDPRPKLRSILRLIEEGHLPAKLTGWAEQSLDTVRSIYSTMDDMEMNGVDVPTFNQEAALKNYYCAACRWLRIDPEEEEEGEEADW